MAELESSARDLPLDAIPRSQATSEDNETEAVALSSGDGPFTEADCELDLKGEAKLATPNDQDSSHSIAERQSVILVMGVAGVGKSRFINCLTDRDVKMKHGVKSLTAEIEVHRCICRNRTTFLADVPAFGDPHESDIEVLQEITDFICQTYANGPEIAGIIYLHSIEDSHVTRTVRNLRLLTALCGETFLSKLVLATTEWDRLMDSRSQRKAQLREWELRNSYWKDMLGLGAKIYRHDNTKESALGIVDHIQSLEGKMSLDIQQEMIQQNCRLDQTLAGQQVRRDLIETIGRRQKELLELQNEYVEARKAKNLEFMELIEKEKYCLGERIAKLDRAKKGLHVDFGSLEKRKRKSWYQDEFNSLVLEKHQQKPREDFTGIAELGIMIFQNLLLGGFSEAFGTLVGTGKWKQAFTRRTESCGELIGVTSTDGNKERDQQGAHGRTPKDSENSSTCSEEPRVGGTPLSYPLPEETSQPAKEPSHCCDLLSMDGSAKAADAEVVQNTTGCSEGSSPMTDSSLSEDATDWGEDSDMENDVHQLHLSDSDRLPSENQEPLIRDVLDPMKKEIVDRLMEEFWIIFNRNWPTGARLCPAAPRSNCPSTSGGFSRSDNSSGNYSGGRRKAYGGRGQGDKEHTDDGQEEGSGEPSNPPNSAPNSSEPIEFACPYRKRNPRKYCMRDWRSCALNPLKKVARVKGHLYRYHLIHQCQRCKSLFKSEEELDSHIETSERCDAVLAPPVDGITRKMRAVLQCKRKAFPGQTEAERWKQIYQILFPDDEEVPDPYFEPVRDNEESEQHSPDLRDLSSYAQFLQHCLPRLVRSALETEINNDIQPIEERLKEKLPDLVEHALSRAFIEYRAITDGTQNGYPLVDSGYGSNHSRSASSQDRKGKGPMTSPRAEISMLSTAYSNHASEPSNALLSPFSGTAPTANLENSAPIHQNFEDMCSSEHPQLNEAFLTEPLSSERLFSSNLSFDDQFEDPISNMMDMDSSNWELPLQEDPYSEY